MKHETTNKTWILTPVFGIILFIMLYIIAAFLYPGGSEVDPHAKGFSWKHNYWCNLLSDNSLNGTPNGGQPVAIIAFVVLAFTLLSFWYIYPKQMRFGKQKKRLIHLSGLACVIPLCFLSSSFHDTVINVGGFFGLVAMGGIYYNLYQKGLHWLLAFGILNLLLIGLNNYVYHTKEGFKFLPVLQKITFLACLFWIGIIDLTLYRRSFSADE